MSEKEEEKVQQNADAQSENNASAETEKQQDANAAADNDATADTDKTDEKSEKTDEKSELEAKVAALTAEIDKQKKDYLLLYADFQNFKKRKAQEVIDTATTSTNNFFKDILSLVDDVERAIAAMDAAEDVNALREGVNLIHDKFNGFLAKNEVKAIETADVDFNPDLHEAITTFAAGDDKKGKIVDCTQKGYLRGEKVLRVAKVVVGA